MFVQKTNIIPGNLRTSHDDVGPRSGPLDAGGDSRGPAPERALELRANKSASPLRRRPLTVEFVFVRAQLGDASPDRWKALGPYSYVYTLRYFDRSARPFALRWVILIIDSTFCNVLSRL